MTVRVLFISQTPLNPRFGAPKVLIEVADAMRALGCACDLVSPEDIGVSSAADLKSRRVFIARTAEYLKQHETDYDAVDFDIRFLPVPRSHFSPSLLLVARSVLLPLHLDRLRIPNRPGLVPALKRMVNVRRH